MRARTSDLQIELRSTIPPVPDSASAALDQYLKVCTLTVDRTSSAPCPLTGVAQVWVLGAGSDEDVNWTLSDAFWVLGGLFSLAGDDGHVSKATTTEYYGHFLWEYTHTLI